jgi:YhcH/YjgK/YiaL family protein
MIQDRLVNAKNYFTVHPAFKKAFEFLMRDDLAMLPAGRYEIDGEKVYGIVALGKAPGRHATMLEAHRKYIDIHFVIAGSDEIGWRPLQECIPGDFDEGKDCGFLEDAPQEWIVLPQGEFAIFFPDDAHAPLAGSGEYHKIVIKIMCNGS